jgi:hypothetical protein
MNMQQWGNGTAYLNEMLGECTGFVQFIHRDFMNVMCIVFISNAAFKLSFYKTSS